MLIEIIDDHQFLTTEQEKIIQDVIKIAAKRLGLGDLIELDISFVTNEVIQQLNYNYRQKNQPTDVLSFALEEVTSEFDTPITYLDEKNDIQISRHLGDIIISFAKAVEQAADYGHSLDREIAFLVVHGFLHLNGFDHQTEEDSKEMFALQEEVLQEYGLTR